MRKLCSNVIGWFEHRLGLRDTLVPLMRHPVPPGVGWFYVFGSATMTLLMLQVATGMCLAMIYVPSADQAYESLEYLNYQVPLGWLLRAIHNTSASGMVVMMAVHMTQVFLFGAYKYPRELTWLVGVGLFCCTLGLAFSGQVLRWDSSSYWGVGVGAAMLGRVPWIGPELVHLMLGGEMIGSATLSRFFALHVFILPVALVGLLTVHLYLVVKQGVSEPPVPGEGVDPKTYDKKYKHLLSIGEPFFPNALYKDGLFSALTVIAIVGIAMWTGPEGPGEPPNPGLIEANPRPDWYFMWLFAVLALSPPQLETIIMLVMPVVAIAILVLVAFVGGKGERSPRRRPVAVLSVISIYLVFAVLTYLGFASPWSPKMHDWSGAAVPVRLIEGRTPLEMQGAVVLQNKACRNCHALDGIGGERGPDLTTVGARLNRDQLVRQVLQGGGNMPAYGRELSSSEVDALVAYLASLRPEGQPASAPPVELPQP